MKKILLLVVSLLLITGCGDGDDKDEDISRKEGKGKEYGIKFLGYGPYFLDKEISKYLTPSELEDLEIILYPGDEYFLIVPNDEDDIIGVHDIEFDSEGNEIPGFKYRRGEEGGPVLLRANVSDIRHNTEVFIGDTEGNGVSFNPFVNSNDGSVNIGTDGYELLEEFDTKVVSKLYKNDYYSINVPKNIDSDIKVKVVDKQIIISEGSDKLVTFDIVEDVKDNMVLTGLKKDNKQYYLVADFDDDDDFDDDFDEELINILLSVEVFDKYEINNEVAPVNHLDLLRSVIGEENSKDKILTYEKMTAVVEGFECVVVSVGTNHKDKVTKEEFYAFRPDNNVIYYYDVYSDDWNQFYRFK